MDSEYLIDRIKNLNARKIVRAEVADWVLARPETMPILLDYCFKVKDKDSYKATWILELVCLDRLELLYPYLDRFFENLSKVYQDQALRPMAKICQTLTIAYYKKKDPLLIDIFTTSHKETMTNCCFDWLITDQRVACEVFAMSSLFYLGTEIDWIHSELKTIIETNIHERSPGYQARSRQVLGQIRKFRYKS